VVSVGAFRVYFNRHGAAPLVWCIAPEDGAWELAVAAIDIRQPACTVYRPKTTPDEVDGKPSAWIAAAGRLVVTGSTARIEEP
jgi:hypothetical protein